MDPSAPEYKYPGHTNNNNFIAVDRAYNTQPEVSQAHLVLASLPKLPSMSTNSLSF